MPRRPASRAAVATLGPRALGRATLARQLLLARDAMTPTRAVEHLVGLQAQEARPPFVALWSRLAGFDRAALAAPIRKRALVRVTAMRATLHLMTAKDYLRLRGAVQPVLTAAMTSVLRGRAAALDVAAVTAAAVACLADGPLTFDALRDALAARFPDADVRAMGYAVRTHLPLVQVPTDDAAWAYPAAAGFTPAATWLGATPAADGGAEALVRRYLAAFGPATAADVQTWTGLRGLAPVLARLRPTLTVLHDQDGRELFDLPDAPRPPEDVDAPVRFLPEFDNLVLGHADRRRVVADAHRPALVTKNLRVLATFLVDGMVAGTWKLERKRAAATVTLTPFVTLRRAVRAALTDEGERLARFVEPDATHHAVVI